jgi:hypothetical protein
MNYYIYILSYFLIFAKQILIKKYDIFKKYNAVLTPNALNIQSSTV